MTRSNNSNINHKFLRFPPESRTIADWSRLLSSHCARREVDRENERERERNDSCGRLGGRQGKEEEDSPERATSVWLSIGSIGGGVKRGGGRRRTQPPPLGVGVAYATAGVDGRGGSARSVSLEGAPQGGSIVLRGENSGTIARQCGPFVRAAS